METSLKRDSRRLGSACGMRRRLLFVCISRVAVRDIIGTTHVYSECHYLRTIGRAARRMFNWKIARLYRSDVVSILDSSLNRIREAPCCGVFDSSMAANNESLLDRENTNKHNIALNIYNGTVFKIRDILFI